MLTRTVLSWALHPVISNAGKNNTSETGRDNPSRGDTGLDQNGDTDGGEREVRGDRGTFQHQEGTRGCGSRPGTHHASYVYPQNLE